MCTLSETSERWTSLGTSHDERIMTAVARSKALARCSAKFCELTDVKLGENFHSAHERVMTERADTSGIRTKL